MARLTVVAVSSAPAQAPAHELGEGELSIGRAPENDLSFPDERMSRHHARVCRRADGYVLIDCGSLKGSLLNGERVAGERALRDGDRIRLGGTELLFEDPPPAPRRACGACGTAIDADARFCPACGKPAAATSAAEIPRTVFSPPSVAASTPPATEAAPRPAAGPRRSRGGLIALLLVVVVIGAGVSGFLLWRSRTGGAGSAGPAAAEGAATGKAVLPASIAPTGLRVLAPSDEVPLEEGSRGFRVKAAPVGGEPPFLALASATGKPLLLGEAGADLSARSTALALVLLDAEVARRGRAAVRSRAQADPRLAELTALIERALAERPAEPLGGEASDGIYRLAAAITKDALGGLENHTPHAAAPTPGGPLAEEFAGPTGRDLLAGRAAALRSTTPPIVAVEDDPGHKTDDVEVLNHTFCYYRVTATRDGVAVPACTKVLMLRNKPYTFMRLAWPPVGKFETRRSLPAGNGKLELLFDKDVDLTIIDILGSAVSVPLGSSGLPQLRAEEDIRVLMGMLGQGLAVVKDFKVMYEQFKTTGTPAEAAKALAAFFGTRLTTLTLAFAPLIAKEYKEHYIQALGYAVSKKLVFAITAGYAGTDMLSAMFCLARQPEQVKLSGEQRFGVWPAIDLTVQVREKTNTGEAPGRLFAVAAQLGHVPEDLTSLELRFTYPGDPEEDVQELDAKLGLVAARDHRFVKATEAVVAAHLPKAGKLVAKGAATLAAPQISTDTFAFERAGWQGTGRITIVGDKIAGEHKGKHKLAPHSTELSLEGTFDSRSMKGSGNIRGGDTMSFMGRAIKTAWEGTFEAELRGDRLEIRFSARFTQGGGPFSKGMSLPPGRIVARGIVRSP